MQRVYESQQWCPIAHTLDIAGDRWTLLIVRDLCLGRSKFNDILESLAGISGNLLADRLKRLEQHGIVQRFFYSDHPPRAEYCLTEKGTDLCAVVRAMSKWGFKYQLDDEAGTSGRLVEGMARLGARRTKRLDKRSRASR